MSISMQEYARFFEGLLTAEMFDDFLASLEQPPRKGACFDSTKIAISAIKEDIPSAGEIAGVGYFNYPFGEHVSDQPLYAAGAFYPLDYSAYCVAKNLAAALKDVKEPRVLDMCAAPGGKTIALANNKKLGLLVANDLVWARAQVLKTNVERSGLANAAVISADPQDLTKTFTDFFEAIILDAPCSGSGMGRKRRKMADDWSLEKVQEYAKVQTALLATAYRLLAREGVLAYATCSYSREENEDIIQAFLAGHPDCTLLPLQEDGSLPGYGNCGRRYISGLFPGEGQYCCLLKKNGGEKVSAQPLKEGEIPPLGLRGISVNGLNRVFPAYDVRLAPYRLLKAGYAIDDIRPYAKCPYDWDLIHYEPSPFADLALNNMQARAYMRGEDLRLNSADSRAFVIAKYKKLPLGFAKVLPERIRNLLPAGLRYKG